MSERIVDDPSLHGWVDDNGKWVWDGTDGSAGAGMIVSETEPTDPVTGMQWLNALTGEVFIYDDGKWLEMPGGKDGAPGADGADGNIADGTQDGIVATWDDTAKQWTPSTAMTVNGGRSRFTANGEPYAIEVKYDPSTSGMFLGSPSANEFQLSYPSGIPAFHVGESGAGIKVGGAAIEALTIDASGDATFSGNVTSSICKSTAFVSPTVGYGLGLANNQFYAVNDTNSSTLDDQIDIGGPGWRFKNAHFSGTVNANGSFITGNNIFRTGHSGLAFGQNYIVPRDKDFNPSTSSVDIGQNSDRFKDGHFSGTVYANGSPLTRTVDLIKTLSTLRQATMDETRDIRESLRSAIDELVEGFEQQISTMEESE